MTQNDYQPTVQQFKISLLAYEESEHSTTKIDNCMMKAKVKKPPQVDC